MNLKGIAFWGGVAAMALSSCAGKVAQAEVDPLVSHIDTTVRPQDDFFDYATGAWFAEHEIEASENSMGLWKQIGDTINAQIAEICQQAAESQNETGSNKQKIGDLYFSGMDTATINQKGLADIKPYLDKIDGMESFKDLPQVAAEIGMIGRTPFFSAHLSQDDKNSTQYVMGMRQGGLSLSGRRFYDDMDERAVNVRAKFVTYMTDMFANLGYDADKAAASAKNVMELENSLAKISRKAEALRDPFANYNKMTLAQLQKSTPDFDWTTYFTAQGYPQLDSVVVGQPEYFAQLNGIMKKADLNTVKDYMKFQFVDALAEYLDDKTYGINFDFRSKVMTGAQEQRPRWKRCVDVTNRALGDLVGQVYVTEYLPAGTKEKFIEIGNAIKAEFANHIQNLDWMSDVTKEKALAKLNAVKMKLAYPDKWKDMSSLEISRDSYVQNMINVRIWNHQQTVAKYGKPVDREEWGMKPQTYNASYSPSNNAICIPGCNIIVPGFKGMPDDAVLYSIIGGSTFGHEITHGFDDEGCNYDAEGNLKSWWTEEDKAKFDEKTKLIIAQFDGYEPLPGLHINGANTAGENIADLGGIIMGFEAFKKTKQYQDNEMIGGFTPAQRYFLAYAEGWRTIYREEALATRVKSDVHSPAKWRVIGPLQDLVEFYEAFDVKEGDAMWRPDSLRVKIW